MLASSLFLYSVDQDKSTRVTDGLSEVTQPAFDKSGKYLYAFASTDAGPLQDWFAQSNLDFRRTRSVYVVVLRKDLPNPLAKESDEEKVIAKRDSARRDSARVIQAGAPAADAGTRAADPPLMRIDFDGIEYRIVALPIPAAELSGLTAGDAGQVYFVRETDGKNVLHRYYLNKRKDETVLPEVDQYELSADSKKILYRQARNWFVVPTTGPVTTRCR